MKMLPRKPDAQAKDGMHVKMHVHVAGQVVMVVFVMEEEVLPKHQFVTIVQIAEGRVARTNVGVSGRGILVVVRMALKILMNTPLPTTQPTSLKKSKVDEVHVIWREERVELGMILFEVTAVALSHVHLF